MDLKFGSDLLCSTKKYREMTENKPKRRVRFAKEIIDEQVRIIRERFNFSHGGKKKKKKKRRR